jgi:hypothetical protein
MQTGEKLSNTYGDFYMFRQKLIAAAAIAASLIIAVEANAFDGKRDKKPVTFTVRVENVSDMDGLVAQDGSRYPFAVSPGVCVVSKDKTEFFKVGKRASSALEAQAEDGDTSLLAATLASSAGAGNTGVFNKPVGSDMPGPLLPGGAFEFTFKAFEGMKLNIATMFGQSNDLFYAPAKAINLFDAKGTALAGDITSLFQLWDAGTEVNQAPGIGPDQAPRQKAKNTGTAEKGVVHLVKDAFTYPATKDVLRITITAQ